MSSTKIVPEITYPQLLQRAVWILGQRDHGTEELKEKLRLSIARKALRDNTPELTVSEKQLDEVIQWCQQQGYLDDNKFSHQYLAQRSRRGYGPQRIRMELQRKGIDNELIQTVMDQSEVDWQVCAKDAAEKKAGRKWPTSFPEKVKLQRYLYSRGFQGEDIRAIFENISY